MNDVLLRGSTQVLTYIEFFSGVGGWSFALEEACYRINNHEDDCSEDGSTAEMKSQLEARLLAAFDYSDVCNSVFHHNFPPDAERRNPPPGTERSNAHACADELLSQTRNEIPLEGKKDGGKRKRVKLNGHVGTRPISIEKLSVRQLEGYAADVWMMSPPCQPHTRQHSNQGHELKDSRSKSFLHLCDVLEVMDEESLPKLILLENVVGFEKVSL